MSSLFYHLFSKFLDQEIFHQKQYSQDIHYRADLLLFCFSAHQIQHYIRDHTHGDTLRDAVEERHRDDAEECRDSFCRVIEIDLRYGADHVEAYNDQAGASQRTGLQGRSEIRTRITGTGYRSSRM
mgnify:CR=1 FL=1